MTHRYRVHVHYEDTDMGGIVYHANFLKFIERARSAWVRDLGVDQNAMRSAGTVFVVRRVEADFLAPARLDDVLEVETRTLSATGARLVMDQTVTCDGKPLFHAVVTIACLGAGGRPARLPAILAAHPPDTTRR
ncbi:acyl-CoA thioester hydrolase [Roseovarius sp. MBR-78]|jgi:acyl-CoA thioester hydrolase|uniref:tol-pal system-associated acyl-CoA thioesterase n=1 Tax=Roseovarius sp. MBR-78 TaxID=3156460 RepID=UPI003393B702